VGISEMRVNKVRIKDIIALSEILNSKDKTKLYLVSSLQAGLSLLDLIGVTFIGIIGALTISGVRSQAPAGKVGQALDFLGLENFSFQSQTIILAFIAVLLLVTRTLLSVVITRRTLFFLSRRSAEISSRLITQVMAQPLSKIKEFNSQHIHYTLSSGTTALTIGVFGNLVSITSDLALVLVVGLGIALIDPLTAFLTISIFTSILFYMYQLTNQKNLRISQRDTELKIQDSEILLELVTGYREAFIRNRRGYFVDKAKKVKWEMADYSAEIAWMPNISKYVVEIAFTLGTMLVAALQFVANDSAQAVGSLTLFLAAGTRITPALLRVQQNVVSINGNIVRAKPTVELFSETSSEFSIPEYDSSIDTIHEGFNPFVEIVNLSFQYSSSNKDALTSINLEIPAGKTLAIVGPSGSGKSTLVDLILGIYSPKNGSISISGLLPSESILKWPGAIGYVPQDIVLMSGSIGANISSGFDSTEISDLLIKEALTLAKLDKFIDTLPNGINSEVGERGGKLSGGQRQRVGIARAMFTKPKLLVFDEATSSLDGQTESEISEAIQELKGKVTLILIAHRLTTVQKADRVVYIDGGKILAQGSFDEVRKLVPDFNKQAELTGL
jgi:ABC-type multidrug transport system fused ATPase/permease subunit